MDNDVRIHIGPIFKLFCGARRPEKNGDAPEGKQQQKGAKRKAEAEAGDQPASKEQATE